MAEFLTMQEAEDKFGKKGKTNAALHTQYSRYRFQQHQQHNNPTI